ncbi:RGS-domain-containing protein [Saitoella complicata NRRL Y-17804]|uniref:RGS-domain-containing protein n=1 Tax=Saitoella complicata (strain BCRC 22490 / CBS 7301 / JCM 7358 / NBRC 10748 / NRRL Y-17804) TaxID=698492 RepID=UPI000866E385|nr:RGS-domain-containing protein [Saitoella complicata NRRL Y-17804]ODQ55421.1 RGS-domain-containing protein [Saitoella complicata NRRL Y-17804]
MHQSSSRLMKTTPDGRPFTRDFKDLFSTLMVSLPLTTHRYRFKSYPFTFTTEEAVTNLGNLKFSQSNRMPDPKDPSRVVTTTTTTTFSMAAEMAKDVCQRYMDARLFESATDKDQTSFKDKCLWKLTPKGIIVLERFSNRNGVISDNVARLISSPFNTMQLFILERDIDSDTIPGDKTMAEVVFRRFAGRTPNAKSSTSQSDNDSILEYSDGMTGVKLASNRRVGERMLQNSFTGRTAMQWLMDCTTCMHPKEAMEIAQSFLRHGLIVFAADSSRPKERTEQLAFSGVKSAIYIFTERGRKVAGWDGGAVLNDGLGVERPSMGGRGRSAVKTNTTRLNAILSDPALRSLFREHLKDNFCEENYTFYTEVVEFTRRIPKAMTTDAVREGLAMAYGVYNAFLAPGSPCELNLNHQLRLDMAARMTKAVGSNDSDMKVVLEEVLELYERAKNEVFKLMAVDSVPKFVRGKKYLECIAHQGHLEEHSTEEEHEGDVGVDQLSLNESVEEGQQYHARHAHGDGHVQKLRWGPNGERLGVVTPPVTPPPE